MEQALQIVGALVMVVGPLGSLLEAFGTVMNWPKLVAFAHRMEAVGADLPKLWRGSRYGKEAAK
jgi:hypothetical protein